MPKLILGFVGQAGCGKGTAADLLREQYGADYFRFSGILGDILNRLSLEKSRENFIKASEMVRKFFGEDVLSYTISKDAVQSASDIVIVDGIRRMEDIVALEPLPEFKMIAIDVPARLRYERMISRGEKANEQNMTWEQFLEEEHAPTEVTIPGVMARAWRTIPNDKTREAFETEIHNLMKELGFQPVKK
ncbi:MAG TPA: AAA family ATPase [Patescibacteria group bacterium]|nr:AAA family ATPase [Patescibacteria group bacterium]